MGAADKAHTAAFHIKSGALLQKSSTTSAAHVEKKMLSDMKKEVAKTAAAGKPKKGTFTEAEIRDAEATAKAAKAASDALDDSMGYAKTAARTLGATGAVLPVSEPTSSGGIDPDAHPKIHSGRVVDEAAKDEEDAVKAQEKNGLDDKEKRDTDAVTVDKLPSEDGSAANVKPKTERIANVLRGSTSEENKVQQIKKIVHERVAASTSSGSDVHTHLKNVKDKLAVSKAKIDNLAKMEKATAAVKNAARQEVTKAHGDVTKEAMAAGLAPKVAMKEAAVAVNHAASDITQGKTVVPL